MHGWDLHVIPGPYKNYMSKAINAYEYAKITDATHLLIVDAYDVIISDSPENLVKKVEKVTGDIHIHGTMLFNAEKACWPYPDWADKYPKCDSPWKYLNGGVCFVEVEGFRDMFKYNGTEKEDNDQVYYSHIYLNDHINGCNMLLDTGCEAFQSVAFADPDDFIIEQGFLVNRKTKTIPSVIHGNGGTDLTPYNKLLNL